MKGCIICGGRTGSHEHIFPASLGGRRTNKGIYCGDHNQGFSPLAAILSRQLRPINALLGVRPDHSDKTHELESVNPVDQQNYLISALKVQLAHPRIIKDETGGANREVQMLAADEEQLQEWLSAQRAAGAKVQISSKAAGRGYFTQPYKVELVLGGKEGLRAIGYVALTFLAHYFPKVARRLELRPFKDFVLGNGDLEPVWWDLTPLPADVPGNAFRFGHRILIGASASHEEAFARVFLFSTLSFSAYFGSVPVESNETVVVDIDPHADHPPDDIRETREKKLLIELERPSSLTESLSQAIESGEAQARFTRLLKEIFDWQLESTVRDLLPELKATTNLPEYQRFPAVKVLLGGHGQRVLNLMLHVVGGFKRQLEANADTAPLSAALNLLIAGDANSPSGLSQPAACAIELGTAALADQICRDLKDGQLNEARLSLLLCGGPGAAIVGRAILQPFVTALGSQA